MPTTREPRAQKANDRTMGWVVDGSFNHKGFDGFGVTDFSINTVMVKWRHPSGGQGRRQSDVARSGHGRAYSRRRQHRRPDAEHLRSRGCRLRHEGEQFLDHAGRRRHLLVLGQGRRQGTVDIPIVVGGDSSGSSSLRHQLCDEAGQLSGGSGKDKGRLRIMRAALFLFKRSNAGAQRTAIVTSTGVT